MKEIWVTLQMAFSGIGGWLGYFLGGFDGLLYALIAFTVIDYATGIMKAITQKSLNSSIGFRGIARKVAIFFFVGVGEILDTHVIGSGEVFRNIIIFFYLSNEGLSIIENATHIGLPVPQKLATTLSQLHHPHQPTPQPQPEPSVSTSQPEPSVSTSQPELFVSSSRLQPQPSRGRHAATPTDIPPGPQGENHEKLGDATSRQKLPDE